jgi:hypothetical protein
MKRTAGLAFLVLLGATMLSPAIAQAQPSSADRAVAETLFREGRKLMDGQSIPQACRKFEESYRLDATPGTLLNMARCHQLEGKIATAWAEFIEVQAQARRDNRPEREQIAVEAIKEIEPRLPKILITVPEHVRIPGLKITRNGTELGQAVWGTEVPADPGNVDIVAEAPGYRSWKRSLGIEEQGRAEVVIPELERLPPPKTPPGSSAGAGGPGPITIDQGSPVSQSIGLVLAGAGVISIGVGSYFGVQAINKQSDAEDQCNVVDGERRCDAAAVSLNRDAKDAARVANLTIGLGAAAVIAGSYLYLTGRPSSASGESSSARSNKPALDVGLAPLPGGGFATVMGGW